VAVGPEKTAILGLAIAHPPSGSFVCRG